jgi:hypothetical protein
MRKEGRTKCPVCKVEYWTNAIKVHIYHRSRLELAKVAENLLNASKNKEYTFSGSVANRQCPHFRFIKKHTKQKDVWEF